jgi:ATP-dependent helicase/DNAse subunit B
MTTTLYTAPAATGKTAHCIALAREATADLRAEVRVCVPTGLQAVAWRQRLAAGGGSLGVRVLSYDRLVAACLDAAGETYCEINRLVQFHLLRTIIAQEPLSHYDSLRDKPGFVQVAQQFIEELKSARIDPPAFRAAAQRRNAGPRLLELAGIYDTYQTRLQQQEWADRVGLGWLAVDALAQRAPDACRDWPLLIVDGFDDFTPIQLALLAALSGRVGDLVVTLPQATQTDFPRYSQTRTAVTEALGCPAQPLPPAAAPGAIASPPLARLATKLFATASAVPEPPLPAAAAVALHEAPDAAAEVRTALRWLKQQMVAHDLRPSDVALLARDMTPYRLFIDAVAQEFELPVRLEGGLPLLGSPVIAALLELLRVQLPVGGAPGLPRREVVALWRSPYFVWGEGEAAITAADADWLDTIARSFRVIRGADQWAEAFVAAQTAWGKARDAVDDDDALPATTPDPALAAALRDKFNNFDAATRPPTGSHSLTEFVAWLEGLIGPYAAETAEPDGSLRVVAQARAAGPAAAADMAALRTLKDVLRGLVWAEAAVGQAANLDFPAFYAELAGALRTATYTLPIDAQKDSILAASIIQARGLGFEAVAVLGLGEGSFPATLNEDPFLRDDDRAWLRDEASFDLRPSTLSAEREFFYEAVTRPRRALLLTRSVLADNGAEWVASPFWGAVRQLVDAVPQAIRAETPPQPGDAASWVELWESVARRPGATAWAAGHDPATWDRISATAAIWRDRRLRRPTPYDGRLAGVAGELRIAFGPETVWSASRLEKYQTCAFMFYTDAVLRLEPRPDPAEGLDARQFGSLYHRIFEEVYRRPLPLEDEAALRAVVARVAGPILDAAPEKEGFRETPWWSQTRVEIVDNVVQSIVTLEGESGDYRFFMAEAAFGLRGNPPLVIGEGDDRLAVRGFIDRVDRDSEGNIRVIDYKSGGKSDYTAATFAEGKKLQLPLYALAAQEALGLGRVTDGFYWHFKQAESSSFKLRGDVDETIATAVGYAREAVARIREGEFTPRPPDGGCPPHCAAAAFCLHYTPRWGQGA